MTHSPTPWRLSVTTMFGTTNADGSFGAVIGQTHYAHGEVSYAAARENAERIVACVNACDGIDTDVLAGWTAASGMSIKEQRDGLLVAVAQLRAERDASIGVANELRRDLDGAVRELNRVRALLTEQGL